MLFNSYGFLFAFLPIVLFAYWQARSNERKKLVLVVASYVFYLVWSVKFAALMFATTSVDYLTAKRMAVAAREARKRWLVLSLVSNLGVLAVFKYYDFFAGSVNVLAGTAIAPLLRVALPIGISFYTFESMSYVIDVYRREVEALTRFLDYAHFVTMFPRLVAGPIVRYRDLADQLRETPASPRDNVVEAVHLLVFGMAKKVLVADFLAARVVGPAFAEPQVVSAARAWEAALGYTAQLYFDFSGYSDMAVGLGLLVGLRLPRNFLLPYAAANPSEFWRRWHVSLSTWLRDYLYIPLGGNRCSKARMHWNLFVTMLLGGLWHGANWTFVVWGALHGAGLVLYNGKVLRAPWMPKAGAVACTFVFVVVGWVIFRAPDVHSAMGMYAGMLGLHGLGLAELRHGLFGTAVLVAALAISFTFDTYDVKFRPTVSHALAMSALAVACVTRLSIPSPFLYFQF